MDNPNANGRPPDPGHGATSKLGEAKFTARYGRSK